MIKKQVIVMCIKSTIFVTFSACCIIGPAMAFTVDVQNTSSISQDVYLSSAPQYYGDWSSASDGVPCNGTSTTIQAGGAAKLSAKSCQNKVIWIGSSATPTKDAKTSPLAMHQTSSAVITKNKSTSDDYSCTINKDSRVSCE